MRINDVMSDSNIKREKTGKKGKRTGGGGDARRGGSFKEILGWRAAVRQGKGKQTPLNDAELIRTLDLGHHIEKRP